MNSTSIRSMIASAVVLAAWLPGLQAGEITFSFAYDGTFDAAGTNKAAAQADMTYVGNYLSSVIKTSGEINNNMKITISRI